jgi:hypothetical protein
LSAATALTAARLSSSLPVLNDDVYGVTPGAYSQAAR